MGTLAEQIEAATRKGTLAEQIEAAAAGAPLPEPEQEQPAFLSYEAPTPSRPTAEQKRPFDLSKGAPVAARRGIDAPAELPVTPMEAFARGTYNPFNISAFPVGAGAAVADALDQPDVDSDALAAFAMNADGIPVTPSRQIQREVAGPHGLAVGKTVGRGMGAPAAARPDTYDVYKEQEQAQQDKAAQDQPLMHGLGQGVTQSVIAAPLAEAPAATIAARAAQAAKVWGPMGALAQLGKGVAHDEGTVDLAIDTAAGGVEGALGGIAGGELAHGATQIPKALPSAIKTGYRNLINNRAASAIEAEHGPELAEFAKTLADPNSTEGAAARAQARAGGDEDALAAHGANLNRNVTQIAQAGDTIQAAETIAKKARLAGKMMADDAVDPRPAVEDTDQMIQGLSDQIKDWKANTVAGHPDHNFLTRIDRSIQQYQMQAPPASLSAQGTPYELAAQRFALADQVKREMQDAIKGMHRSSPAKESMNLAEQALRRHLEDSALWGPQTGTMQAGRNAAWHGYLNLNTHDVDPGRTFLTDYQGIPSAKESSYRALSVGSERDLTDIAKKAGTVEGAPEEWKLRQWGDRAAELGRALVDHPVEPDDALTALAQSQRTAATNIEQTLNQRIAEKAAADKLADIQGTPPRPPGTFEKAVDLVPHHYLEAAGGLGLMTGHGELGAGALALGAGAQAAKNVFRASAPEALAQRATQIAHLEAQAPTNPAARAALASLKATPTPMGVPGATVEQVGRAAGAQFSGDQLRDALKEWANGTARGETKGHDLDNAVQYALERQPALLGPYQTLLQQSDDIPAALHKLSGDPQWVKTVLPRLQDLTR